MKLYTRLIDSGVFVFWGSDEGNTSYNLKIRVLIGDDKIELVNLDMNKGENYYSFDRVGSGDYEIELNGYKDEHLYQTETKKITIISSVQKNEEQTDRIIASVQKTEEQTDKIITCFLHIFEKLSSIENNTAHTDAVMNQLNDNVCILYNQIRTIADAHTDPKTIVEIRKSIHHYEQYGY